MGWTSSPPGRLKNQIGALPEPARQKAMAWLKSFHFTENDVNSLHADSSGGILYACALLEGAQPVNEPMVAAAPAIGQAAVPLSPFPSHLLFHSKPGAPNVLYLDFDGETVVNTYWNEDVNRSAIPAVPYSTDSDTNTFSDAEQAAIKSIWMRVAEDYAPFNVDVTTERPASFGPRTGHAVITKDSDANGQPMPYQGAGGVAYIDVFGYLNFESYRPAWVYINRLSYNEPSIAEATSHELGHNMGLSHDGKTDNTVYYTGHGSGDTSWAPIMGSAYGCNVTQWSRGEYYMANNTEDDLAIISGKLSYRSDDHANTIASATALILTGTTNIFSTRPDTDPANTNAANKGVLDRTNDVDVFSFTTGPGQVTLSVNPWIQPSGPRGGNCDILLELYGSGGALVASNNPASTTGAQIQTNLSAGTYYLAVKNVGTGNPMAASPSGYTYYGGVGQYFIQGILAGALPVSSVYIADMSSNPGWTLEPQWQYGVPQYSAGSGPTAGHTGSSIIGYNLAGNYENRLARKYATTPGINASTVQDLTLKFRRWLRLVAGDTAIIQASVDNVTWHTLWSTNGAVSDTSWQLVQYPIPSALAGSANLKIRWGLESNNSGYDIGWNLDDVEVMGAVAPAEPMALLTVGVNHEAWGKVSVTNNSYPIGTSVQIVATPNEYYQFANWSGDVESMDSVLTVTLLTNVSVVANFSEILTMSYLVPFAWLDQYGYSDFENEVFTTGANGLEVWQSYVAGLNPRDPGSQFRVQAFRAVDGSGFTLSWSSMPDRVYTVLQGENLQEMAPLMGLEIRHPTNTYTVPWSSAAPQFFKVGVSRPSVGPPPPPPPPPGP